LPLAPRRHAREIDIGRGLRGVGRTERAYEWRLIPVDGGKDRAVDDEGLERFADRCPLAPASPFRLFHEVTKLTVLHVGRMSAMRLLAEPTFGPAQC